MKLTNYGMPTLIETVTLEDCAKLCAELGLDFIELNMNMPQYQLDKIDAEYFKSIADKYGIYYTIHLDENLNVSDFNPYVAQAYIKTVADTVEIAKQLGVKVLNMHMARGVYFTLPDRKVYLFSEYKEQYLKSIVEFRNMCETTICDSGIKICIENCDGYEDFQKEVVELLLESKVFALTFDVGHNHSIGGTDEEFIMKHKDRLQHIHLHDAKERKNHLALGTGETDIQKYISLADEQKCRVVLETKTVDGLKKSVEWINQARAMFIEFEYLNKLDFQTVANDLFNILADNMKKIAPTGNTREEDYKCWYEGVSKGLKRDERQIILIKDNKNIIGFFQYYINADTFMMEEIQLNPEYQGKGIFRNLYGFLLPGINENIKFVEAYANIENHKSIGILGKLGLAKIGMNKTGSCCHFRGSYSDLLKWYTF